MDLSDNKLFVDGSGNPFPLLQDHRAPEPRVCADLQAKKLEQKSVFPSLPNVHVH
jgi:hypothetical protein